jgi:hypothetical protein
MQLPESIGAREIAIGVGALLLLLVIGVPLLGYVGDQSKRSEPQLLVESIRAAQIAQNSSFPLEGFISADWAPRDPTRLDGAAVPWATNDGFTRLGWSPEREGYSAVRCAYKVAATRDDFIVTARCDLDADGQQVWIEATRATAATVRSDGSAR